MPRELKPGQIGDFWLSQNRHGSWCRTWFDAKTRQTRRAALGAEDFDAAVIALARWYVANAELDRESPSDVPLAVALDRYYEGHARQLASSDAAQRAIAHLKKELPDLAVSGLTLDRQGQLLRDLRGKGFSDGYIARIQTTLKAAVNRAYRAQEIASAPYIKVIGSDAQRERVLAPVETAALFNAEMPDHLFAFLMLSFNTLARPEAVLELQPFQFDGEHRLLMLNPPGRAQTKKYRPTVPVTDALLPWLRQWAAQRYFVLAHKYQVKPIGSVKKAFRTLRKAAGLSDDVVPYTIRHTMATELRRRGVPKWEVDGMLGHKNAGTTERYAKFSPDYLGKAAAAIDDYFHALQPLVRRELVLPLEQPKRPFTVIDGGRA